MLLLALIWWSVLLMSATCSKHEDLYIGTYPTNTFTETVSKFVNNRPIVGIVAMELKGAKLIYDVPFAHNRNYFGASFVKIIEAAGGRAVGIKEDIPDHELKKLLHKLSGVVLPGGDADSRDSGYEKIAKKIVKFSINQKRRGIIFPVLGFCRGAQLMMLTFSENRFLIGTDSVNFSIPLNFTKEAKNSRMFGHAPKGLMKALSEKAITFNAHSQSLPYKDFFKYEEMKKHVRILSTNYARDGQKFISTYEGREAPFYGLQWHPEKSLFNFNPVLAVDHTVYAIAAAQYIANFFMNEARQNPNTFTSRLEEEEYIIYRKHPVYVGNITETPYEQIYLYDYSNPFVSKAKEKELKKLEYKERHKVDDDSADKDEH